MVHKMIGDHIEVVRCNCTPAAGTRRTLIGRSRPGRNPVDSGQVVLSKHESELTADDSDVVVAAAADSVADYRSHRIEVWTVSAAGREDIEYADHDMTDPVSS